MSTRLDETVSNRQAAEHVSSEMSELKGEHENVFFFWSEQDRRHEKARAWIINGF